MPLSRFLGQPLRRSFRVAMGAGLLSGPSLLAEAEERLELPPFSVQARRDDAVEGAASVTVVTSGRSGFMAADLSGHFATVPGVHFEQPGGPGGRTTLYLRGGEENHALVLLDGIPLNDPTNSRGGAVDLSLLGPSVIKQVAVTRGLASVRNGPEALAGLVLLETRISGVPRRELFAAIGEGDFHRLQFDCTEAVGEKTELSFLAADEGDGELSGGGRHDRRFLSGAVRWEGPASFQVRAAGWYGELDAEGFPDDSGGIRYAQIRTLERRAHEALGGSFSVRRVWNASRLSLLADVADFDTRQLSPGVSPGERDLAGLPGSEEVANFQRTRLQLLLESEQGRFAYAVGADVQREVGDTQGALHFGPVSVPFSFNLDRERLGIFGEMDAKLPANLVLSAGVRGDRFTDEDWRATVRGGIRGPLGARTEWRLQAGNAFKPPSFYALANPLVGNPELEPEKSETAEGGLRHAWSERGDFVEIVVFSSRYRNGIDFDPGPPPTLLNRSEIRSEGIEGRFGWHPFRSVALEGSVSYVDASLEPSGEDLRKRPDWWAGLRARWQLVERLTFGCTVTWVGPVADTSIPTGDVTLPSWARVDFAVEWRSSPSLSFHLALGDAADRRGEGAVGFVSQGRRARLGVHGTF